MSFLNADIANAVNPYLSDVGVGLVFGLGYYVINYLYGDNKPSGKEKRNSLIIWDSAKTIDDFNLLIKECGEDTRINPFEILDKINKISLHPDITIYNNLINICYVRGQYEEAVRLVDEIFDFGSPVQPDLSTFNILLKGISLKLENNLSFDEKRLCVEESDKVFFNLQEKYNLKPNDVTINTKMDILIKAGKVSKAWDLFDEMKTKYNVEPDKYSYSTIIKALKYEPDSSKLDRTFGILELLKDKRGCSSSDEIIFNCLIDVCVKLGKIEKAETVFRSMKEYGINPTKITYAVMIRGYGQVFNIDNAFNMYEEMKELMIEPNEVIYGCLLNACVRCSNFRKLSQVYEEMQDKDVKMNIILYTTLIKAYTKAKSFNQALQVYEKMLKDESVKPNIVVYNAMLDCCVECGCFHKMNEIYEYIKTKYLESDDYSDTPKPDLITYSTIIKGYAKNKDMNKVFEAYDFLQNSNDFVLDEVIYNSVLDACAKTNNYSKAMEVYSTMTQKNITKSNVTYSILVKIFSNNKEDDRAILLLDEMKSKNIRPGIIVYTCLIQTCLKSKKFQQAIDLFEDMKKSGLKPDHVLYNTIVNGGIYSQRLESACIYTIESFNNNIRMADDIYITVKSFF